MQAELFTGGARTYEGESRTAELVACTYLTQASISTRPSLELNGDDQYARLPLLAAHLGKLVPVRSRRILTDGQYWRWMVSA